MSRKEKFLDSTPSEVNELAQLGYREIAERLTLDIRQGVWKTGAAFPTEAELVGRFGTSRNTVRESLRELEILGYVKRRRGARSILVSADPASEFVHSVQSIGEWLHHTHGTVSKVLTMQIVVADFELSRHLGVSVDSKWLRAEVMRENERSSPPVGFSELYIDARYANIGRELQDSNGVAYTLLESRHGLMFRQVSQKIQAIGATANISSRLNVPLNSPILCIRTDFITTADQLVEIGFWYFPAGRFHLELTLKRGNESRSRRPREIARKR
jgi:GntR family transcriptional regulator